MRVSLPPVRGGGSLGAGVHGRHARGPLGSLLLALRRGGWTVPLPVALCLLLALACVFQYQLYRTLVELDQLVRPGSFVARSRPRSLAPTRAARPQAEELRECSVAQSRGSGGADLLRQRSLQLTGAAGAGAHGASADASRRR